MYCVFIRFFFFFKQKTAYEWRISDWSSDVCSSDLAEVRDLKDRGVFVLVDRDDGLGILHARKMLGRARDADREIDFRRDDLAGLADLIVVGDIARIDRGARRAERRVQLVGERDDHFFIFLARPQRATARHDDLGRGEFGTLGLRDLGADKARQARSEEHTSELQSL